MRLRHLLLGGLLWLPLALPAAPLELQLCQSDEGDYPWTLPDRAGLNNLLIERAVRRTGVRIRFHAMPWARCLFKVSTGDMDGVVGASYRPERQRIGAYPLSQGRPDAERRLMRNRYLLYRRTGDTGVQWDGRRLVVSGPVGVPTGYSIADTLRRHGATIAQQQRLPARLLQDLIVGDLNAVAITAGEGERLLADHDTYQGRIEPLPLALEEKDFYLVFSHRFRQRHPALTDRLWHALMLEQRSSDWQQEAARFR